MRFINLFTYLLTLALQLHALASQLIILVLYFVGMFTSLQYGGHFEHTNDAD